MNPNFFLCFFFVDAFEICSIVNEIDKNVQKCETENAKLKNSDSVEIEIEKNVRMCEKLADKKNDFKFFDSFFIRELNF